MGAENQINKGIALFQLLNHRRFLHHTAAEGNLHLGIAALVSVQLTQPAIDPLVGVIPYGTGVENHKIRMLVFREQVSRLFQDT